MLRHCSVQCLVVSTEYYQLENCFQYGISRFYVSGLDTFETDEKVIDKGDEAFSVDR